MRSVWLMSIRSRVFAMISTALLLGGCDRDPYVNVYEQSRGQVILLMASGHNVGEIQTTVAAFGGSLVLAQPPTYVYAFARPEEFERILDALNDCPAVASAAPNLPGHI